MKKLYQNILLLYLMVSLSACPYIPVYRFITQTKPNKVIEITPLHFFYETREGFATCSVGLRFYNQQDSIQEFNFSKSYLLNAAGTLKIEKILALGVPFESDHVFNIPPKKDTVLGFYFKDLEKNFGDTIKVILDIYGVKNDTFIYKKVKNNGRFTLFKYNKF